MDQPRDCSYRRFVGLARITYAGSGRNRADDLRLARLLPEVIRLVQIIGPYRLEHFLDVCAHTICLQCGHQDGSGTCVAQRTGQCRLYRSLPLIYDTLSQADDAD